MDAVEERPALDDALDSLHEGEYWYVIV